MTTKPKAIWTFPGATGDVHPYPANTILVVEVGSTAHGTGIPDGEDHDEMVVTMPTPQQTLGIDEPDTDAMWRTKPEGERSMPGDIDRQIYSLAKFVRLALAGNPSIMLAFWAPVLVSHPIGRDLQLLGPAFVGRHIVPRYRGYMAAQIQRLDGLKARHGKRASGRREELIAEHGYDTKFAMHAARLGYQGIELLRTGRLELPMGPMHDAGNWLRAVRRGEVPQDEWRTMVTQLDHELDILGTEENYNEGPDRAAINEFCLAAYRRWWGW